MTGKKSAMALAEVMAVGGFEVGTIALLHRLGRHQWMTVPWGSLQSWLDIAPIENVVAAVLRSIALVVAYWVAASTVAYLAARITRVPHFVKATAWATLPPVRRAIDRVIAVTVTATTLAAPLAPVLAGEIPWQPEPVVYELSGQGIPTPVNPPAIERAADPTLILPPGVGDAGYTPRPAGGVALDDPTTSQNGAGGAGSAAAVVGASAPRPETGHTVAVGDNLWAISAAQLRKTYPDRDVDAGAVATYWRRVIEVNTPHLQSGNPNLIYPGELIVLPAPAPLEDT